VSSFLKLRVGVHLMALFAVAAGLVVGGPFGGTTALAQGDLRDPREIALFDDEGGGKESLLLLDEDGRDDRSRWVVRRWERDQEASASVGPLVTYNKVWVAKDVETAKAIFREEENKQRQFPEKINPADGFYEFEGKVEGIPYEELSMLSGCVRDRCDDPGRKDRHHRLVARKGPVVVLLYLFGREHATKPELVVYFLGKNLERV
jgi:hypothetical protein